MISNIWQKIKRNQFLIQLIRYCLSGGIAFIADFGLTVLLKEKGDVPPTLAATAGYIIGLIITYLLSIFWIFDQHRFSNRMWEFLIFAGIGLIGIAITFLCMQLLSAHWQIHYIIAKLTAVVLTTLWNFLAKKYILFSKTKPDRQKAS